MPKTVCLEPQDSIEEFMLDIAHGILCKVHLLESFNMWIQGNVEKLIRLGYH